VFDGIEFYLPQLAHMIIHLEAEWDDAILERFALVIAQQSLHFALQFNWILNGALEDYQPELPSGLPNPSYNPLYYARCIKLLTNLERCVVYGRPRSQQLQRLYEQGKITKQELHIMENADRRFHALQLTSGSNREINAGGESSRPMMPMSPSMADINKGDAPPNTSTSTFGSVLMYKRPVRLGAFRSKGWKKRYFVIEEQMLNCYRSQEDGIHHRNLVRAMPLDGATITDDEGSGKDKYPHMFTVSNREYEFKLRAKNKQEKVVWMRRLTEENEISSLFQSSNLSHMQLNHMKQTSKSIKNLGTADVAEEKQQKIQNRVMGDLTPSQLARYEFFRNERRFVRRLTDIAEELRFLERDERKKVAPGLLKDLEIPKCVYLPLCNSSDTWRRVCKAIPEHTKVFSTKARCPMIMYFLARFGEEPPRGGPSRPALSMQRKANLDVAEYMHMHFEVVPETVNGDKPVPPMQGSLSQISESGEGEGETWRMLCCDVHGRIWLLLTLSSFSLIVPTEMTESQHGTNPKAAANLPEPMHTDVDTKGSRVWHNPEEEGDEGDDENTNRRTRGPRRASFAQIPKRLADRMESRRKGKQSVMDNIVDIQTVPILEGQSRDDGDDASIGSSVMFKTTIVLGETDLGDIDRSVSKKLG
jgi:PH domain